MDRAEAPGMRQTARQVFVHQGLHGVVEALSHVNLTMRDGEFVAYGDLSAATLHDGGKIFTAIRAKGPDGKFAWYDENGRSIDEVLTDETTYAPDVHMAHQDDLQQVVKLLDKMDKREAAVLRRGRPREGRDRQRRGPGCDVAGAHASFS